MLMRIKDWTVHGPLKIVSLSALLVLATLMTGHGIANADDHGDSFKIGRSFEISSGDPTAPWRSISNLFSGRVWLITSGLDPVIKLKENGETKLNVGGTSSLQVSGASGAALIPYRDPSAKFSRNILVSEDTGSTPIQTEPHIAVNPKDPNNIIVGMIDYNSASMVAYTSIDKGSSWEGPKQIKYPRSDLATAGDPVLHFDSQGTAYYAFISLDIEEFRIASAVGETQVSSIVVGRSTDGGFTWEETTVASRSGTRSQDLAPYNDKERGSVEFEFMDKPWMGIGPHPTETDRDIIYVAYTKFIEAYELRYADEIPFLSATLSATVIEVVHSDNQGITWSDPVEVSPRAFYYLYGQGPLAGRNRQVAQGSTVTVAANGTAYVGWLDSTTDGPFEGNAIIHIARTVDGGATFSKPRHIVTFMEPGFKPRTSNFRYWSTSFPRLAAGPKDQIYLVHGAIPPDNPEDEADIYFLKSTDGGVTWSRRMRLNDDKTERLQFFPEIDVGPDGVIHIMWGDVRDDPTETAYHIYYSSSEDEGKTWSVNSRVSDFPTNPNRAFPGGRFIGDYFGIQATKDDVYMVWADGRLGEFGGYNQKIAFARKSLMPTPSIFISPPRGPAGKDVMIQGFDFQPNREIFIEVAGAIISTDRTNSEGRFSSRIFIPIGGEGAHPVRVIDSSGNVASSSFYMDFGFDNLQDSATKIDQLLTDLNEMELSPVLGSELNNQLGEIEKAMKDLKSQRSYKTGGDTSSLLPIIIALIAISTIIIAGTLLTIAVRRHRIFS
jgi:hypothetical protein